MGGAGVIGADPLDHGWLAITMIALGLLRTLRSRLILKLRAQRAWKVMEVKELREARSSVKTFFIADF